MMKPKIFLAALMVSGSAQVWAAPAPVSEAAASKSNLEQRIGRLEEMIQNRNLLQVELQQQLNILQEEVSQLRGVTEEQGYKLEKVLQRQRELYQEIENRVSQAYTQPVASTAVEAATGAGAAPISADLSENEAYDRAVQMIMRDKRYDQAIPEFKAFLEKYPQSVYASNAHYWLGQLLTIKGDSAGAVSHFTKVVDAYPDSNKRADSMLKLGTLYQEQKQVAKARIVLQQLVEQYPDSTAAKLATERLAKL